MMQPRDLHILAKLQLLNCCFWWYIGPNIIGMVRSRPVKDAITRVRHVRALSSTLTFVSNVHVNSSMKGIGRRAGPEVVPRKSQPDRAENRRGRPWQHRQRPYAKHAIQHTTSNPPNNHANLSVNAALRTLGSEEEFGQRK